MMVLQLGLNMLFFLCFCLREYLSQPFGNGSMIYLYSTYWNQYIFGDSGGQLTLVDQEHEQFQISTLDQGGFNYSLANLASQTCAQGFINQSFLSMETCNKTKWNQIYHQQGSMICQFDEIHQRKCMAYSMVLQELQLLDTNGPYLLDMFSFQQQEIKQCHLTCAKCSFAGTCLNCLNILNLDTSNMTNNRCNCLQGYVDLLSDKGFSCQICINNVLICAVTSNYSVPQCQNQTFRTVTSTGLVTNTQITICPCRVRYYETQGLCKPCSYTCLTCSSFEQSSCLTCDQLGFRSINNYLHTCRCNIGYYDIVQNSCASCSYTCLTCSSQSQNCLSCNSTSYRTFNKSLFSCPCDPGYSDIGVTLCAVCDKSCLTCSPNIPSFCLTCDKSKHQYLYSNRCFCEVGYYLDLTQSCSKCDKSCANCEVTSINCVHCSDISQDCTCFSGFNNNSKTFICEVEVRHKNLLISPVVTNAEAGLNGTQKQIATVFNQTYNTGKENQVVRILEYLSILGIISFFTNYSQVLFQLLVLNTQPSPLTYHVIVLSTIWMTSEPLPRQAILFDPGLTYTIYNSFNITSQVYESTQQLQFLRVGLNPFLLEISGITIIIILVLLQLIALHKLNNNRMVIWFNDFNSPSLMMGDITKHQYVNNFLCACLHQAIEGSNFFIFSAIFVSFTSINQLIQSTAGLISVFICSVFLASYFGSMIKTLVTLYRYSIILQQTKKVLLSGDTHNIMQARQEKLMNFIRSDQSFYLRNQNLDTLPQIYFEYFCQIRKFVTAALLVFLYDYPTLILNIIIALQASTIVLRLKYHPDTRKWDQILKTTESLFILSTYLSISYEFELFGMINENPFNINDSQIAQWNDQANFTVPLVICCSFVSILCFVYKFVNRVLDQIKYYTQKRVEEPNIIQQERLASEGQEQRHNFMEQDQQAYMDTNKKDVTQKDQDVSKQQKIKVEKNFELEKYFYQVYLMNEE